MSAPEAKMIDRDSKTTTFVSEIDANCCEGRYKRDAGGGVHLTPRNAVGEVNPSGHRCKLRGPGLETAPEIVDLVVAEMAKIAGGHARPPSTRAIDNHLLVGGDLRMTCGELR